MMSQDNLGKYLKELPKEEPSFEFTNKVMDRILTEAKKSPAAYHPLISRQMWIIVMAGIFLLLVGSALIRTYFPATDTPAFWQSLYQIDFSVVFEPIIRILKQAGTLPVSFAGGLMAFSLLLVADRIYSRHPER